MDQKAPQKSDRQYYMFALRIVGDFGASIAVPVVLFALLGQYLDEKYNKSPWFTILGFVLAAVITARLIYRKAKKYGDQYQALK